MPAEPPSSLPAAALPGPPYACPFCGAALKVWPVRHRAAARRSVWLACDACHARSPARDHERGPAALLQALGEVVRWWLQAGAGVPPPPFPTQQELPL